MTPRRPDSRVVLALNPGSSSVKAAARNPELAVTISIERLGSDTASMTVTEAGSAAEQRRPFTGDVAEAVDAIAAQLQARGLDPAAIGHRVVHGGPKHHRPTRIDTALLEDLHDVIPLAPLHLPGDLESIGHARRVWPSAAHVACFDTGFHHDLPEVSRRLPVPAALVQLGVRRYGFHGLSVQSVLHAQPELGGAVIAHLGSGCSVTAVADGEPRHTTMSLTPTGGTISATRTGDLDPEIVLFLIQQHGYTVDALRELFDRRSGLAGVAGGRHDVRDLLAASDPQARLALEIFAADVAMSVAACASRLDRWDSLVFTGGVGEHSAAVREDVCARLLALRSSDPAALGLTPSAGLSATGVRVLVVRADEESVIDRRTRQLLDRELAAALSGPQTAQ
jgi:acetate kinase